MLSLQDFDYHLPDEKIAQKPVFPRDQSKLLIVDKKTDKFEDKHFSDLVDLLTPNDVLVLNNTKVFPARLLVHKTPKVAVSSSRRHLAQARSPASGIQSLNKKPIELLLEKELSITPDSITWSALTKPGLKIGDTFEIPGTHVTGICTDVDGYTRKLTFHINREHFFPLLDKWAQTPIPPYIKWEGKDESDLRSLYQTVFAKKQGAVAAPTAGLHFTPELLEKIRAKGVQVEEVTLHVGLGTFLPVKTDKIEEHHMHSEWYELPQPVAENLLEAKHNGKRIIAVGTTVVRVLETCAKDSASLQPGSGTTSIFMYPPYKFTFVDSIITNFHTPKSTLLMLVSAFVSTPNTDIVFSSFKNCLIGKAYDHALAHDYRFYSFGDAMWIR